MNVVNFNQPFIEALSAFSSPNMTDVKRDKLLSRLWNAPLFDVALSKDVLFDTAQRVTDEQSYLLRPWPFNTLRASLTMVEPTEMNVTQGNNWAMQELVCMEGVDLCAITMTDGSAVLFMHAHNDPFKRQWVFCCEMFSDGQLAFFGVYDHKRRWMRPDAFHAWLARERELDNFKNTMGVILGAMTVSFDAFIASAMSPQVHIATVCPEREHKSVEWRRARTHYTLITHGHPANKTGILAGARVSSDREGELTRMAHNRRAHYRMLRHERYRYARGKRVFVKASWVGPKEWRDEGGRQVYRILEEQHERPL